MRELKALVVVVLLAFFTVPAWAQLPTASTAVIVGTVTDPTAAVVPGAEVVLLETATNLARTQTTNAAGYYVFSNIFPGVYRLTCTMQGFRQAMVPAFRVETAQSYTINFTLEIGAIAEVVEVEAGAEAALQALDATVGATGGGERMLRMPSQTRTATTLLASQPLVMPGGEVAGSRSDQSTFSLDGTDVSDNVIGQAFRSVIPTPVESIEEFRVGVTNPNATFGRSSGGQLVLTSKRGTNTFHGSVYWYHQNDNMNANSWVNNRVGNPRPELKDNRYGFRVGGPIFKDKTFFHWHYEGRRFPQSIDRVRLVPTDTDQGAPGPGLRQGVLRFRDNAGNVISYNLNPTLGPLASVCSSTGTGPCEPRAIGFDPSNANFVIDDLFALLPRGNDTSSGDGLNTIGFRSPALGPREAEFASLRIDHNFTDKWRFDGSFRAFRDLLDDSRQLDISGLQSGHTFGVAAAAATQETRPRHLVGAITGQLTSSLTNEFRFSWLHDRLAFNRASGAEEFSLTRSGFPAAYNMAIDLGEGLLDEPIDIDTQRARSQARTINVYQFIDNVTWTKGRHTMNFGGTVRLIDSFDLRDDKVVGSLNSLVLTVSDGSFVTIPDSQRPVTCATSTSANCLPSGSIARWSDLYSAMLGLVDNVSVLIVRDGSLTPIGFPSAGDVKGSALIANSKLEAYDFYFSDTWRIRPSFTLTYGIAYQWQTPPREKDGKNTFIINNDTGEVVTSTTFLRNKALAARAGQAFSPTLGYVPINDARAQGKRQDIFDTDWSNVAPRLAAAWHPSFRDGFLGRLFGDRKSVFRGGYSVVYDRLNTVGTIIIPQLGVGFGQTISRRRLDTTGAQATSNRNAANGFRVGVDGAYPLPANPGAASSPIVPPLFFSELLSFQVDPDIDVGRNHSIDFTIQRELPGEMILEVGYAGKFGRRLPQSKNLNGTPLFHRDPISRQTFAQAFDAVATELRAGVLAGSVTPQAWFENQIGGGGTVFMAANFGSEFVNGLVSDMWLFGIDFFLASPVDNLQALELFMRTDGGRSNYHGGFVSLRKRMTHGLDFGVNYTYSKSLDQVGAVQNSAGYFPNPYDQNVDYGPSFFDRRHVLNGSYFYELPFGRGRRFSSGNWADKIWGGWYTVGTFNIRSGIPLTVDQSDQVWGGGVVFGFFTGAIPLVDPNSITRDRHLGVAGSGGVGTSGDPAAGGTGMNMFSDPEAVLKNFRPVLIGQDGRGGRANPLYGFNPWFWDISIGKKTSITESVQIVFSMDFFNVLNHMQPSNPTLDMQNPQSFGVVTSADDPRTLQFGFRIEF